MNQLDGLAVLHFGTPHFEVVKPGSFVLCAESHVRIALEDLVYWSVEFQEAYRGPEEATRAFVKYRSVPQNT